MSLDKIPVCGSNAVQHNVSHSASAADALDDATEQEGDEHRLQISGAPQASVMCVENSESFNETICVPPAEGERRLGFMTDPNFEAMSNPDKFPYGNGTFSSERSRKLTYRKYFNHMLMADLQLTWITSLLPNTL